MSDPQPTAPRILVVEDDAIFHSLVVKVLRRAGYETVSAFNGEEALATLRRPDEQIDWLLTDIRLAGVIDGWVVGSEFHLTRPLRPVVYMSGVEPDVASKRGENSLFLPKPFDNRDLVETFKRLVENCR